MWQKIDSLDKLRIEVELGKVTRMRRKITRVEKEVFIAAQLRGVASTLDDVIESILGKDLITLVRNKKRDSLKQAPLYLFRLDLQERLRSRHSTSVAVAEAAARVDRSVGSSAPLLFSSPLCLCSKNRAQHHWGFGFLEEGSEWK